MAVDGCQAQTKHLQHIYEGLAALAVAHEAEKTRTLIDLAQTEVGRHCDVAAATLRQATDLLSAAQHVPSRWNLSPSTGHFIGLTKRVEHEVEQLSGGLHNLEQEWKQRKQLLEEAHYSQVFELTATEVSWPW